MTTHTFPEPTRRSTIALPDGEMSMLCWDHAGKPRLFFAHANGFCASTYKPLFSSLVERYQIIAIDLRGHGRSTLRADPARLTSWRPHADDIAQAIDQLEGGVDVIIGHSMGATSSLMASAALSEPLPVLMIEPVILPRAVYLAYRTPLKALIRRRIGMGDRARRRSNGWQSRDEVVERYCLRPTFSNWVPGAVEAYLEDGLRQIENGWVLACDPQWEAANFEAQADSPFKAARLLGENAKALKAGRGSTLRNPSGLRKLGVSIDQIDHAGHLLPMTHPTQVADWIKRQLDGLA